MGVQSHERATLDLLVEVLRSFGIWHIGAMYKLNSRSRRRLKGKLIPILTASRLKGEYQYSLFEHLNRFVERKHGT